MSISEKTTARRLRDAVAQGVDQTLPGSPWWLRLPANLVREFSKQSVSPRSRHPVIERIATAVSTRDSERIEEAHEQTLNLLSIDRLPNGGWGRRNNKTLRTFYGELPDDFDTDGSITLTRWVVDAITGSRLATNLKEAYIDEKLNAYLDARFDRVSGASGRIGAPDLVGRRPIHPHPRHTAASIMCYLGADPERFGQGAQLQLEYLYRSYQQVVSDPNEVGHPDILRAISIASWHELPPPDRGLPTTDVLAHGFSHFWDWVNSPTLIPKAFGAAALPYLRLYSLCSVADLVDIPAVAPYLRPIGRLRRVVLEDCQALSDAPTTDHRRWGFPLMLLWSSLHGHTKDTSVKDALSLLSVVLDTGGDFTDGFCVYWALLFAITDAILAKGTMHA